MTTLEEIDVKTGAIRFRLYEFELTIFNNKCLIKKLEL
jgi:hypothetical protein